jgi:hypothetical protein
MTNPPSLRLHELPPSSPKSLQRRGNSLIDPICKSRISLLASGPNSYSKKFLPVSEHGMPLQESIQLTGYHNIKSTILKRRFSPSLSTSMALGACATLQSANPSIAGETSRPTKNVLLNFVANSWRMWPVPQQYPRASHLLSE